MAEGTTVFVKWKTEEFSVTIEGGHTLLHLKNEVGNISVASLKHRLWPKPRSNLTDRS